MAAHARVIPGAISQETATDIAYAYREIATAEKLLTDLQEANSRRAAPDIRDAFGRRQDGLQLGVPSGEHSHRMFNVPWTIAKPIVEAHVASQRTLIAVLTQKAREEMNGLGAEAIAP